MAARRKNPDPKDSRYETAHSMFRGMRPGTGPADVRESVRRRALRGGWSPGYASGVVTEALRILSDRNFGAAVAASSAAKRSPARRPSRPEYRFIVSRVGNEWCVIGAPSGFCYDTWDNKADAVEDADEREAKAALRAELSQHRRAPNPARKRPVRRAKPRKRARR